MKRLTTTILSVIIVISAMAQELPRASSKASVHQMIGLTDVSVDYFRPNKKERVIWGGLVPYDVLWRTGANAATRISFSTDVKFGGADVPAGPYALFTIPGEKKWTVILNSEADQWGAYDYDSTKNIAEIQVTPVEYCETAESFTISFESCVGGRCTMAMKWDNLEVPVEIEVDLKEQVMGSLEEALKDTAVKDYEAYNNVAVYLMRIGDHTTAKEMAMKSRNLNKDFWYSAYVLASVQADKEDYKGAVMYMDEAIELGEKASREEGEEFRYKARLQEMRDKWKAKM